MISNEEKRENYAVLKTRLAQAMKNAFWFEACMIEYAIIEDRAASIMIHAKLCKEENAYSKKLSNKLNSIRQQIGKENPAVWGRVPVELLEQIGEWKEKRNEAVHRACITKYDEEEMEALAQEGKELSRLLDNASSKVKRYAEKQAAKAENTEE